MDRRLCAETDRSHTCRKSAFRAFWGFIFLFFGTSLATIDWDITRLLFGFRILQGDFYLFYKLILDFAGLATLAGLGVAAWSRWIKNECVT